jgi:cell fate (sporulation/competence/biofilm development) regulator YlbF (YheA/YmcA/DUF963 family)
MENASVSGGAVADRARELGQALAASRAFRNYERARERYQNDPAAANLVARVRRLEAEDSVQRIIGEDAGGDWAENLASLRERVRAHPTIQALQQTESELLTLLFGAVLRLSDLTGIDYAEACTGRGASGCGPTRPKEQFVAALVDSAEVSLAVETLAHSLRETGAFMEFAAAKGRFRNDPDLVAVRKQVKSAVSAYAEAEKNGALTQDLAQNVRTSQNKLREHPLVQEFSRRRQEVNRVFQTINQAIGEVAGIDIAQIVAPASGCCG